MFALFAGFSLQFAGFSLQFAVFSLQFAPFALFGLQFAPFALLSLQFALLVCTICTFQFAPFALLRPSRINDDPKLLANAGRPPRIFRRRVAGEEVKNTTTSPTDGRNEYVERSSSVGRRPLTPG